MKTLKTAFCLMTLALTFVINPAYLTGCGETLEFEYTQSEMESTLVWALKTYNYETDAGTYMVELSEAEAMARVMPSLISAAHACGPERAFVRSASACLSFPGTQMEFESKLTITWMPKDGEPEVLVEGQDVTDGMYSVEGGALDNGEIRAFARDANVTLESEDGKIFKVVGLSAGMDHQHYKPVPAPPES